MKHMLTLLILYVIVEPMQLDNGVDEQSSGAHQVCDQSLHL
jgi:hypothetical protein